MKLEKKKVCPSFNFCHIEKTERRFNKKRKWH